MGVGDSPNHGLRATRVKVLLGSGEILHRLSVREPRANKRSVRHW